MIEAAGSIPSVVAIFASPDKQVVAISATEFVADFRYNQPMPRKPSQSQGLKPINQWVVDAMAHAGMSQAELSRKLHARKLIGDDRSVANKIALGRRDVSADEAIAIEQITGYPALNDSADTVAMQVPHLSWISAGAMQRDDVSDEAIGLVAIVGLPPGDWFALTVRGTSMDRISPPDSIIFVNRRDKALVANACYIIDDGEGNATYKRYRPNPMRFEPVSNEEGHETLFPDNDPSIVGRVGLSMIRM